jgi:hypothetical protein
MRGLHSHPEIWTTAVQVAKFALCLEPFAAPATDGAEKVAPGNPDVVVPIHQSACSHHHIIGCARACPGRFTPAPGGCTQLHSFLQTQA